MQIFSSKANFWNFNVNFSKIWTIKLYWILKKSIIQVEINKKQKCQNINISNYLTPKLEVRIGKNPQK